MKPRRIARGEKVAAGLVLVRDVAGLPKGRILSEADVRALESAGWPGVEALELEPGDVHEEAAGLRLAAAVAGEGVEPGPVEGGSFPLIARRRGLLEVDLARLAALNLIPDLAVNSHPPQYVAVEGNVVARAKVIPFVTREERVRHAEETARGGVVRVRPFASLRGALLVHETIAEAGPAIRKAWRRRCARSRGRERSCSFSPGAGRWIRRTPCCAASSSRERGWSGTACRRIRGRCCGSRISARFPSWARRPAASSRARRRSIFCSRGS